MQAEHPEIEKVVEALNLEDSETDSFHGSVALVADCSQVLDEENEAGMESSVALNSMSKHAADCVAFVVVSVNTKELLTKFDEEKREMKAAEYATAHCCETGCHVEPRELVGMMYARCKCCSRNFCRTCYRYRGDSHPCGTIGASNWEIINAP